MEKDDKSIIIDLVDHETGKIVDNFYEGDSYKKFSLEQKENMEKYVFDFKKDAKFIKLYDEVLDDLSKCLSPTEFRFAIKLSRHVSYDDCILRKNGHHSGKVLDLNDLSELFDENYKNVNRIMNGLYQKGIIGKGFVCSGNNPNEEYKCYFCNPHIYMRGGKVNKTIINFFANTIWAKNG